MDTSKYLKSFIEIGLTEREAKVYMALLSGKMFTVLELQEAVNIPRTKIYEVLNKLVSRNICIERKLGRNKLYEAVEPKVALEGIVELYKKDIERKESLVNQISEVFTPIYQSSKLIVNPLEFIDVMKEKEQIHKRYTSCVRSTKREMLTFNKGPYACDNSERLEEQEDEEFKLLKRGGSCKDIYESKELNEVDWLLSSVKNSLKLGQQARVVKRLPIKMLVFDQEKVMFALELPAVPDSNELTMIYIEHKQLAEACSILFYHLWDQGQDISLFSENFINSVEAIASSQN